MPFGRRSALDVDEVQEQAAVPIHVLAGVAPAGSDPLLPLPVLKQVGPFTIDLQAGLLTLGRGPLPGTTP